MTASPTVRPVLATVTLAAALAACGSSPGVSPPFVSAPASSSTVAPTSAASSAAASGAVTPDQIAATLNAKGVACTAYKATDHDPGASAQGTCGTFPVVIEISVFASHDDISNTFVPFLKSSFCGSSRSTTSYIDAGLYTIYTDDQPTTEQIARAIGVPATPLC